MSKRLLVVLTVLLAVCLTAGLVFAQSGKTGKGKKMRAGKILYVCNCGPDCKCNTVSTKPGKCTCGEKLVPMHILKIEGDEALLCTCGKSCTCKLDPDDPKKCGCGNEVKRVSLKGLYVCKCGEGCECNTVSDKPGKCRCGVELKKVE